MQDLSGVVKSVDHVVDSATVRCSLMCCTDKDELLVACHLGASLACADAKELHDKQVQLEDELADVLILPHTLVDFGGELTDFHDVRGLVSYQFLEVLLHGEGPTHLADVFHAPAPKVAGLGTWTVASTYG